VDRHRLIISEEVHLLTNDHTVHVSRDAGQPVVEVQRGLYVVSVC